MSDWCYKLAHARPSIGCFVAHVGFTTALDDPSSFDHASLLSLPYYPLPCYVYITLLLLLMHIQKEQAKNMILTIFPPTRKDYKRGKCCCCSLNMRRGICKDALFDILQYGNGRLGGLSVYSKRKTKIPFISSRASCITSLICIDESLNRQVPI